MSGKQIKGLTIIIDGETKPLQKALEDVNKKTRDIQGELKSVDRLLKLDPKNTTLLAQKQKLLGEQVDNSRKKLDHLKKSQEQVNQAFKKGEIGEDQYRHFARQVVNAEQDLKGFEKQLKHTEKASKSFGQKMSEAGAKVANIAKTVARGIVIGATTAIAAIGAIAIKAGQTADELLTLSNQTGLTTDALQGFQYASRFIDVELETMQKGLAKVVQAMGEAARSGEDYIDVSGLFRVNLKNSNGELKTSEEMFYNIIDAISELENETQKEIAAQELFSRSYQDIMPLIKAGTGELKKYIQEAERLGLVIKNKDLVALGEFDDAMQRIKAQVSTLGTKIAVALLPLLKEMAAYFQNTLVPAVTSFVEKYANNPEFTNLSFTGKIEFIVEDVNAALNKWWNSGGQSKISKFGTKIAEAIGRGIVNGAPIIGKALLDALAKATFEDWLYYKFKGLSPTGEVSALGGRREPNNNSIVIKVDPIWIKPIKGHAAGTNFAPGGWSWVGEMGPELLNLPRGSQILSHQQSMAAVNNQTVNHTGTVYHVFQTNDRATVAKIAEEFERGNRRIPQRVTTLPSMA